MTGFFCRLFLCVFLLQGMFTVTGCKTENKALMAYKSYTFDTAVIGRLPLYDSLVLAISAKLPLIYKHIHDNDSYHAFRYMPASKDAEVFTKLPTELGMDIDRCFSKIGVDNIYAFDIFKDSTIKIYIRTRVLKSKVNMLEILSYFPEGKNIQHREYPEKDTILNSHWQYRARFDNPGLF